MKVLNRWMNLGASVALGIGAMVGLAAGTPVGATTPVVPGTASQVAALVAASTSINSADSAVQGQLLNLLGDNWGNAFNIAPGTTCLSATDCVFGDTGGTKSAVLYGDSHARMWLPAINPSALTDHLKLVLLGKDGCPAVSINLTAPRFSGCNAVHTSVLATIAALKPKVVILADQTAGTGFSATAWKNGLEGTIRALKADGAKVVVLQDVQEFGVAPGVCISLHLTAIQANCSIANPNPKNVLREPAEAAAAKALGTVYVKTNPWFCTAKKCSPVVGDFLPHFDIGHVSASYAAYLSGVMQTALKKSFTS